jgi:3-isopropylmalate dehydratase
VIEYRGEAISALSMDERMTVCNMSIEAGARAGMIAPDDTTFAVPERPAQGAAGRGLGQAAVAAWRALQVGSRRPLRPRGRHRRRQPRAHGHLRHASRHGACRSTRLRADEARRREFAQGAGLHGHRGPAKPMLGMPVDVVFVGSCTNSRLSDLRTAARVLQGHKVARRRAHAGGARLASRSSAPPRREGLHKVFLEAGAEWRESGCSMCLGMNGDLARKGQLCVSTSNRNFEGRQGIGARTLLASPATAAAAAIRRTDRRSAAVPLDLERFPHGLLRVEHQSVEKAHQVREVTDGGPALHRHRHRPDHPGPLPDAPPPRKGSARQLFADWRYDASGAPKPDFVLNRQPEADGAAILVAGNNFGCGSSREHAPWALMDFGFRAVISTEIADIFRSNSLKNGLLPLVVDKATHTWLLEHPGAEVEIDLESTTLKLPDGKSVKFPIEAFARYCLLNGIDELGYLLNQDDAISRHEKKYA